MNHVSAVAAVLIATSPILACSGATDGPSEPSVGTTSEQAIVPPKICQPTTSIRYGVTVFSQPNCTGYVSCFTGKGSYDNDFQIKSFLQGNEDGQLWSYDELPFVRGNQCINTPPLVLPDAWGTIVLVD
jgi:hypothetical protein